MTHLLKRYFSFFGKASRQQYWLRSAAFLVLSVAIFYLLWKINYIDSSEMLFALLIWMLALSATGVRRCREVGINPHWVWLWLFPIAGGIFYIVLGCLKSDDGVRIARPKPKKGLVHYFSIFGRATRQEYWCISIPINLAFNIASNLFFKVLSFMLAILLILLYGKESISEHSLSSVILSFSVAITYFFSVAWLGTAVVMRRCRDAALNPWWSSVLVIPMWLAPTAFILFIMFQDLSQFWTGKITVKMTISHNMTALMLLLSVLFLAAYIALGCLTSKEKKRKLDR